jgi:hypothetical protein
MNVLTTTLDSAISRFNGFADTYAKGEGSDLLRSRPAVTETDIRLVHELDHLRDAVLRVAILSALDEVVRNRYQLPDSTSVYRKGDFLCIVFPYAHISIIAYLRERDFPCPPQDAKELSYVMRRLGLAVMWKDAQGNLDHQWRIYADTDQESLGYAATLVRLDPRWQVPDEGIKVLEGSQKRRRDRPVTIGWSPLKSS